MNRINIEINKKKYIFSTMESEWYMQDIATEINKGLSTLLTGNLKTGDYDALIALLVNYADKARKSEDNVNHLRNQLQAYMNEAAATRSELARVQLELEKSKKSNQ